MIKSAVRHEIERLEASRCDALVRGDIECLSQLLADDAVHIHGTGQVEGKDDYLSGVGRTYKFHQISRGALHMRAYGDIVIVNGPLHQVISIRGSDNQNVIDAVVTQVWIRAGESWRQNTCHNAFLPRS